LTVVESLAPDNRELRQGEGSPVCRHSLREFSVVRLAGQRQGTARHRWPGGMAAVSDQSTFATSSRWLSQADAARRNPRHVRLDQGL